jgi:F-type H+-transporting ATPase subunit b
MAAKGFLTLALVLVLGTGLPAHAQETQPMAAPPTATQDLPFVNDGANQPVLQPLSPEGQPLEDMAEAGEVHGEKKGLPQFDTSTFARQLFWLALVFVFMYATFSKVTLPAIAQSLDNRSNRLASDLTKAQSLKADAERVKTEYEAAIFQAQSDAQKLIADMQGDMKRTLEAKDADFKDRSEKAVSALEGKIDSARTKAVTELRAKADELAAEISARITGANSAKAKAA